MTDARARVLSRGLAEGAIVAFVALWWWTARGLPAFVLPGPLDVVRSIIRVLIEPQLVWHVAVSFLRVAAAVTIAMALALGLALAARASAIFAAVLERRVLLILNAFPSAGWAILAIIWFQVSNATVIFIEVAILLPFCLINTLEGFRQIDPELDEMGRSFTRARWRRFWHLTLPLLMPYLVAGLRIAYGIGWKIALVAELFGAQSGLGFLLTQAQSGANAALVFAICFIIVGIVFIVDRAALRPLAHRFSRNQGGTS